MDNIEVRRWLNQAFIDNKRCGCTPCKLLANQNSKIICSDLITNPYAIPCHLWKHQKMYRLLKG